MQKEIEKYLKTKYNNISLVGYKYTCRAVEILINNDKLSIMDIYKIISIESNKKIPNIIKGIREYKIKAGHEDIPSKEFIYQIKYNLKEE